MPRFSLKGAGSGGLPGPPRTSCSGNLPPHVGALGLVRRPSPGAHAHRAPGISRPSRTIPDRTSNAGWGGGGMSILVVRR